MQKITRAVIYARYSSENQRDASIDDQIRNCTAFIERQGWRLVSSYADRAISGASFLRHGYQQVLHDASQGSFDIVVAEALDRVSRDQADTATFYKHLSFHGIQLVTLAEGRVDELHVGLKGTMNALFLKDLAIKTRRGLEGRVREGRSAGGICYGYEVVRELASDGRPEVGKRAIVPEEALIVQRIFSEFAHGESPRVIAARLNREGVPGPRGQCWGMSTIYGNWRRGTGILNNELYLGRLVWNRQRFIKDPKSGRRQARPNPESEWIIEQVPHLQILTEELWSQVKTRQRTIRTNVKPGGKLRPELARRPRYLFSGLMNCSQCGGGYTLISARHYGCANARNRGTCANRLSIRRDVLEASVLNGLKEHLLHPDLVKVFVEEYRLECNRRASALGAARQKLVRELGTVERHIKALIEAVKEGMRSASMATELERLELRREELTRDISHSVGAPPTLHPGLARVYRNKVADLAASLRAEPTRAEAAEIIRSLIDQIRLIPEQGILAIELVGALAGILALAQKRPRGETAGAQLTMVAGIGFEPMTFRL